MPKLMIFEAKMMSLARFINLNYHIGRGSRGGRRQNQIKNKKLKIKNQDNGGDRCSYKMGNEIVLFR